MLEGRISKTYPVLLFYYCGAHEGKYASKSTFASPDLLLYEPIRCVQTSGLMMSPVKTENTGFWKRFRWNQRTLPSSISKWYPPIGQYTMDKICHNPVRNSKCPCEFPNVSLNSASKSLWTFLSMDRWDISLNTVFIFETTELTISLAYNRRWPPVSYTTRAQQIITISMNQNCCINTTEESVCYPWFVQCSSREQC